MTIANHAVAQGFVRGRTAKGSNFKSVIGSSTASLSSSAYDTFEARRTIYSYSTAIAHIVLNKVSDCTELWLSPEDYSVTTRQHKAHIRSAWRELCHKQDRDPANYLYPTLNRNRPLDLIPPAIKLQGVNHPRIRENTRRCVVKSYLHTLNENITIATRDLPEDKWGTPARAQWGNAVELRTSLMSWLELPVDDMRATVTGYLALEATA